MHINTHKNIDMIYFKLSDLFRIYTNLYEYVLNLLKNMLTAGLYSHCRTAGQPHTAARTAAQPHTAAHIATHCCAHCAHCMNQSAAHRTTHEAHRTAVAHRN
jgi:hypothetical protein